jgi:CPA2 family monovalent cation:H+ antiporter-2
MVPRWATRAGKKMQPTEVARTIENHVVILGFGLTGRNLAHVLRRVGIPYVVIEMNPETVQEERRKGEPIFFGDAQRPEILEHARLSHARVLVIAINEPLSVRQATHLARRNHPGLHIIVRTRFLSELQPLMAIGASEVIPEEFETALEIFSRTLRHLLVPRDVVESIVREARQDGYGILREETAGSVGKSKVSRVPGAELEVFRVEDGSALDGKTIAESELRRETGASILAVQEDGRFVVNPPVTARLEADQSVVVFGSPEQIARAAERFRAEEKVL